MVSEIGNLEPMASQTRGCSEPTPTKKTRPGTLCPKRQRGGTDRAWSATAEGGRQRRHVRTFFDSGAQPTCPPAHQTLQKTLSVASAQPRQVRARGSCHASHAHHLQVSYAVVSCCSPSSAVEYEMVQRGFLGRQHSRGPSRKKPGDRQDYQRDFVWAGGRR